MGTILPNYRAILLGNTIRNPMDDSLGLNTSSYFEQIIYIVDMYTHSLWNSQDTKYILLLSREYIYYSWPCTHTTT